MKAACYPGNVLYGPFAKSNVYSHKELPNIFPKSTRRIQRMSTQHNFVLERMGDKPATELVGIFGALGRRLDAKGFDKAYTVLGQFLVLKKNEELFIEWLKDAFDANSKQAKDCSNCLTKWCDNFL